MKYGIFSDVHGNLQALEAVLAALAKEKVDAYLCLGDVVGYGANPNECIRILTEIRAACIAGNHDWTVINKFDLTYFNPKAKTAIDWTKTQLNSGSVDFLKALPLVYKTLDLVAVHGTLDSPENFAYLLDNSDAEKTFALMDKQVCFIGHTHRPGAFQQDAGEVTQISTQEIALKDEIQYIVNVGSVGQPRDGNPLAAYCVFDTDRKLIRVLRTDYNILEAQQRILQNHLPAVLATRLSTGQ